MSSVRRRAATPNRRSARTLEPCEGRNETVEERSDRNWNELLQELRVMQTGTQILTGFLLTLPFQPRFAELDTFQLVTYLVLVLVAVTTTIVVVAPVSLHRLLFRRHLKPETVTTGDRIAKAGLGLLGLLVWFGPVAWTLHHGEPGLATYFAATGWVWCGLVLFAPKN